MDIETIKKKYGSNLSFFRMIIAPVVAEANQLFFDLFNNAGSNCNIIVTKIKPIIKGDVAVTGVVAIKTDFFRTSAIGTGGTTLAVGGSVAGTSTIQKIDTAQADLSSSVTARVEPTGGATADDWFSTGYLYSEETNSAIYSDVDLLGSPIVLHAGQGLSALQGSVASVNSYGFIVDFAVV